MSFKFHHTQIPHQFRCGLGCRNLSVFDLPEMQIHIIKYVRCFITADAFSQLLTEQFADRHDFGRGFGKNIVRVVYTGSRVCFDPIVFEQLGRCPVSSRFVPEIRGFSAVFAGLYAGYEKFAGKLWDDCGKKLLRL